jgi:arylsulfatase A-like enzyme
MFTGNYPSSYPSGRVPKGDAYVRVFRVPEEGVLLAEVFQSQGYETACYMENSVPLYSNVLQGVDIFVDTLDLTSARERDTMSFLGEPRTIAEKASHRVVDYLLRVDERKRFFLLIWFLDPHAPYKPGDRYIEEMRFDAGTLPHPPEFYTALRGKDLKEYAGEVTDVEIDYLRNLYLGEVESIDRRIGFIMETLKARGFLEETLVIITADHGEAFGEDGSLAHGGDGAPNVLVHVPLLIRGPDIPSGKRISETVTHVGLAATLVDLAGIGGWPATQGKSFAGMVDGRSFDWGPAYLVNAFDSDCALIEGNYKLVVSRNDMALFDIGEDRLESNDISSECPEVAERLFGLVREIRKRNRDLRTDLEAREAAGSERDNLKSEAIDALRSLGYIH